MITTYIIGNKESQINQLSTDLGNYCPQLSIKTKSTDFPKDCKKENNPSTLFFVLLNDCNPIILNQLKSLSKPHLFELICIGTSKEYAYQSYQLAAFNYLLYPYQTKELIVAVHAVTNKIKLSFSQHLRATDAEQVLGIPTIEGYEFIPICDIIKCEGLQSYTRIITNTRKDIISSNNIGELRKKLEPFGFYAPHKSYIINLKRIRKYSREGVIVLQDGSQVPLARRRKCDFFKNIMHL